MSSCWLLPTRAFLSFGLAALAGCSSHKDDGGGPDYDGARMGQVDGGGAALLDASHTSDARARLDSSRPPTGHPNGDGSIASAEICDGIDNDGDGRIDDVDVGMDGICDCLLLATLGIPGTWGEGDVFAGWLSSRSNTGATALEGKTLTPLLLAPFQVIVAQDLSHETFTPAEVQALQDWIRAGGGLFTLIGYADSSERTNINTILTPTGVQYGANATFGMQTSGNTMPITTWTTHPVSDGITQIGAFNGYEVQGAGTVLASEAGVVALRAADLGMGHVLVWGDEWITYNSEWKDHPDYQVERFWLNAIKWLSPPKECQVPIPILL